MKILSFYRTSHGSLVLDPLGVLHLAQAESPASPASPASPVVSRNLLEIQGGGIRRAWPLVQGETGEVELQKGLYLLQTKGVPD